MVDFMKLMQQAQQVKAKLKEMNAELEREVITATSGGGMVTATVDGKGQVTKIQIDASVVKPGDVEMLEELVLAAVRNAQQKANALQEGEMGQLSDEFKFPFNLSI